MARYRILPCAPTRSRPGRCCLAKCCCRTFSC